MQWVQQPIAKAAAEDDLPLRLPDYVHRKLATSRRIWEELRTELQRDPDLGEVARRAGLPTAELARLRRFAARTISLDSVLTEDDGSATVPDAEPAPQPFDELRAKFLSADLSRALATLDVRERAILRLRFGLGGREPLRLVDVGNRLGLTAERIRQLQAQAAGQAAAIQRRTHPRKLRRGINRPRATPTIGSNHGLTIQPYNAVWFAI